MGRLKKKNKSFIVLLGISLAIHVTLFFIFSYSKSDTVTLAPPSQQGSVLVVVLKYKNPPSSSFVKTSSSKLISSLQSNKQTTSQNLNKTTKTNLKETKTEVIYSELKKSILNKTTLISQIKSEFSQHFKYPLFARRKGWQGKVLLMFNINNSGIINNIKIKNSSGYKILDNAAKRSLSNIEQINISANMNLPINTYLQIPVIYKLTEG